MVKPSAWAAALALATAACGGGGGDVPAPIDCAWLAGDNCWRASAAAATACTDGAATGTLDEATSRCAYEDGTTVRFDLAMGLRSSFQDPTFWDFSVVSSSGTICARYVQDGLTSMTLTTALGTLSVRFDGDPVVLSCPDGSRFSITRDVMGTCEYLGWEVRQFQATGTTEFVMLAAPPEDDVLWRCR